MHRDHLAQERPPEQWAIDFGEAFSDVVTNNTGPALRRGLARLMQHPQYRDAVSERERMGCGYSSDDGFASASLFHFTKQQGTDDHFMAALFAAGAAGDVEDEGHKNYAGAECWELLNMRNVSVMACVVLFESERCLPECHLDYSLSSSLATGLTLHMLRRSIQEDRWFTRSRGTCEGNVVSFVYVIVFRKIDHVCEPLISRRLPILSVEDPRTLTEFVWDMVDSGD